MKNLKPILWAFAATAGIFFLLIIGVEINASRPAYCNSCHAMEVAYTSWQNDPHAKKEVECFACHYAPGERFSIKAKLGESIQLLATLSGRTTMTGRSAVTDDRSCTTAECHPPGKHLDKKLAYTEKINFTHRVHLEKTIDGQKLHCNSCHRQVSKEKHFEVERDLCYLCHFKNSAFNEGRSQCTLCHALPTEPLKNEKGKPARQHRGEQLITHKSLIDSKVACISCHQGIIGNNQGNPIAVERCLSCHDNDAPLLKTIRDKKAMHAAHVATQKAACFDCHERINHKTKKFPELGISSRDNCKTCHTTPHRDQLALLNGDAIAGVKHKIGPMVGVNLACRGCHLLEKKDKKGQTLMVGSGRACIRCHAEGQMSVLDRWSRVLKMELSEADESQRYAQAALDYAISRVPAAKISQAQQLFDQGSQRIALVVNGNGIHNFNYSLNLISHAIEQFEAITDLLGLPPELEQDTDEPW